MLIVERTARVSLNRKGRKVHAKERQENPVNRKSDRIRKLFRKIKDSEGSCLYALCNRGVAGEHSSADPRCIFAKHSGNDLCSFKRRQERATLCFLNDGIQNQVACL